MSSLLLHLFLQCSAVGAEIETGYLSVEQVTVRLENVLSGARGASRFLP